MTSSLESTDQESASYAVAPRVSLAEIEAAIAHKFFVTADEATHHIFEATEVPSLKLLTICIVNMKNGFNVVGKSAPASPENFNADYGRTLAYEDAVRQIWPLMGFALREKLSGA